MPSRDRFEQRLTAVERVVVDGDTAIDELDEVATLADDIDRLESRIDAHDRRIAALEAKLDALNGFAGNVASVNDAVERQANAAVATVDRLEYRLAELERCLTDAHPKNSTSGVEAEAEFAWSESTQEDGDELIQGDGNESIQPVTDQIDHDGTTALEADNGSAEANNSATVEQTATNILSEADEPNSNRKTPESPTADKSADSRTGLLASLRSKLP
ncbi:DUF7310 family coiled-coil domain-containing protein [Natronorubrum thiooxidans]|uniref:DUF7310 domain-containing protein n=1 Tax=Natronorubrum thiooxidans TaxID=308853 RepID=A0A1N7FL14_9EURY|nr:hypothetical protein [Natronorubrum thiooxidans]SIS01098.1 hypothetical protein SAMN05421752_107101 [Natronorubrum thiooxidans]